ncbi:hypothetical protein AB0K43_16950 [Kitasatospora sp. NPDC049258]|uniref:hypothetical protein n=1 Tax=Kitasatospora sp. NPDC049258 TaxID=3155394 RepID=UPI00342DD6D7
MTFPFRRSFLAPRTRFRRDRGDFLEFCGEPARKGGTRPKAEEDRAGRDSTTSYGAGKLVFLAFPVGLTGCQNHRTVRALLASLGVSNYRNSDNPGKWAC